jgi:hypothetical protein
VLAVAGLAAASLPSPAQGTHLWTQSRLEEFEKGTPQGVALTSDGRLREAPGTTEILTTPSSFVWSVAVDRNGTAYLGTASPAAVLRVGQEKDSKPFTLFETKDLSVQSVKLGPDGALYAATLPSGKVYRLKADATTKQEDASATVVFDAAEFDGENAADGKSASKRPDAKAHYIWDLTFDSAGRLYIATGGPGAIYRVDFTKPGAKPELFFQSDEEHLRSLAWDAKGNLIAGSEGSGLVYRISPQGKGYVLFESPRREITAVAVAANGTIYAASVGDKSHNPLPPLPIQGVSPSLGSGTITFTVLQPGSLQAANTSATVPDGSVVYALVEGQAPRKLWTGKDEIVYALAADQDGVLALTGNRGRIFKIAEDGKYADLARLDAQQGLSLATVPSTPGASRVLIGTGNTGKLVCLCAVEKHEYASDVLDTGALARFGRVEVQPGSTGFDLLTRTGNVEQPARGKNGAVRSDWGWSDWHPLKDGTVASPAGRYLQWKAVLHKNGVVDSVGVNYLPVNAAPEVDNLVVVTGARWNPQGQSGSQPATVNISFGSSSSYNLSASDSSSSLQAVKDRTAVTVRWAAHDDNGDDLNYALYLRGDGETVWRLLKDGITDKAYSFDGALIPDGGYQVKVVASDAPSHTPGEALTSDKVSDRFEVDTTPPVIAGIKVSDGKTDCTHAACGEPVRVSFDAEDAFSPLVHAEYSLDAGPWQYIEPVGGLSDSKHEHYEMHLPATVLNDKTAEHLITVRAYDRHDNIGVAKAVFFTPAK